MASTEGDKALLRLEDAQPNLARGVKARRIQLGELKHLAEVLDKGSISLNQRATTLAALAVAALAAFGVFASRLGQAHPHGLAVASAALVAIAGISLAIAAVLALLAAAPGSNSEWSKNFATWATCVIEGSMSKQEQLEHFSREIPRQLRRNKRKAVRMRRAYRCSLGAVVSATLAVGVVVVSVVCH